MAEIITSQYTFGGGINNSLHDSLIADQELADAQNVHPKPSGNGNLIKRCGYAVYSAVASSGTTYVTSFYGGQRNRYFTCYDESANKFHIYDLDDGTTSRYATAGSPIAQYYGSWASFGDYDIFVDGNLAVKSANGTAFTAVANCPVTTNIICPYNNYLFALKTNDYDRLFWSDLLDCETWPTENYLDLGLPTVFDQLTSLRTWQDKLIIFTVHGFYSLHGYSNTDWTVSYQQRVAGADVHSATMSTPYGLIWWNQNVGICICRDGFNVEFPMVEKLATTLNNSNSFINKYSASCHWRPERQCATFWVRDSNTDYPFDHSNLRIDYYPKTNTFWLHRLVDTDNSGVVCCGTVETITTALADVRLAYYVGRKKTNVASVWKETETISQDNSSSYTAYVETKRMSLGGPITQKYTQTIMHTMAPAASGTITYGYYLNNATTLTDTTASTVSAGVQDTLVGVNVNQRKIKHRISDALNGRTEYIGLTENTTVENQV